MTTDAATDNPTDPGGAPADASEEYDRNAKYWQDCITDGKKYFAFWNDKCDSIDKLYADLKSLANDDGEREFQMFWANLEILKPTVYSRPPVPAVQPRFQDMKPLPRTASEMLERTLIVNSDLEDINSMMVLVRDDMLTNGRGTAWTMHDPDAQRVWHEHIDRCDFLHEPARKWQEVGWVAKRAWLTKEQGVQRFGDIFLRVDLKERKEQGQGQEGDGADYKGEKKGEVWEIWSKTRNVVVWITEGLEDVLDIREPFLKLDGFFPCPRPAYSTLERRKLIPVPDCVYYRDQLEEINELTARISALSEALRLKGFYPSGAGDLADAVESAVRRQDNNALLVPVANFAALGGTALKDSIIWLPVVEVANTIKELVLLRRQLIDDVYQITGLSDIMRGATDPEETATAQEIKSQYGNIRVRERQNELVRFARDLTRIAGEIMAENFAPETFAAMSQMELPTQEMVQQQVMQLTTQVQQAAQSPDLQAMAAQNPQAVEQLKARAQQQMQELADTVTLEKVVALLREQKMRPFVLDIETDSTIQPDENMEKQRRTEFLTALSATIQQLTPLVAAQPAAGPFAAEIIKFAVAPFRAGRSMTTVIEEFTETIRQQAQQAMQNPQQSPEQIKAQGEKEKLDFEKQKHQDEMGMRRTEGDRTHERETRKARLEGDAAGSEQGQGPAYSMAEVIEQLVQQNSNVLQVLQMIAQAIAAPKQVTTPEGRTYTTQPAMVN